MRDPYKIERLKPDQLGSLTDLYSICFGRSKDIDFFKWKYFENPAGDALCLSLMHHEDMVGSCCMIPEEFYVFGNKMKVYKCCDLMIRPAHRKKGLSTKLIFLLVQSLRESGPLFLYTFCGKNATPGFLKNKWFNMGGVDYYFKHIKQLKLKFIFSRFERLFERRTLRKIDSISDLCRNYRFEINRNRIHIAKDEEYLKWRLNNPLYDYSIIGYYKDEILKGYAIYNKGIKKHLYLLDIGCVDKDPGIIKILLDAFEFSAYKNNARSAIALAVRNTPFQRFIIKGHNYIRNPFNKGPLVSLLDFNVLIDENYRDKAVYDNLSWDVKTINYDDA